MLFYLSIIFFDSFDFTLFHSLNYTTLHLDLFQLAQIGNGLRTTLRFHGFSWSNSCELDVDIFYPPVRLNPNLARQFYFLDFRIENQF